MSSVISHISVSLDGFAAGPRPTLEAPLGEGGERLHEWALATDAWRRSHGREGGESGVDAEAIEASIRGVGAHVMGRGMFGGGPGPWDESWRGWWGDEPPFHHPVFVLTHHPREPLVLQGGTTFTFVTDGIEAAVAQAREAAGDDDVAISGGARTIQQTLAAGLLDELVLHIVPTFLGSGTRLLENAGDPRLEVVDATTSPAATHVRYRVLR